MGPLVLPLVALLATELGPVERVVLVVTDRQRQNESRSLRTREEATRDLRRAA